MQLLPIKTPILRSGDDLAALLIKEATLESGDIIVISSKAGATVEDAFIDLTRITPSKEAEEWSEKTGRRPEFLEAVLAEAKRIHGAIVGHCPGALLTELRPDGLIHGSILTANAGLDESNAPKGMAIGWPVDPVASVVRLKQELEKKMMKRNKRNSSSASHSSLAVILSDSNCRPRRIGVTAFALTVAGLDPLAAQAGKKDLFGKELRITTEAVADQLATAANFVMGNAGQSIPAVIVRDHGLPLSDFIGWVPGIEPAEDLFAGTL